MPKNKKIRKQPKFLPAAQPTLDGNELKYIKECFKSNWIAAGGPFVKQFESEFAELCNRAHGVATSSGTTALHLALLAYGIKPGDEVIVPDFTFAASANCALHSCAIPNFVDADADYFTIDVNKIEEAITSKTKAIIPVHVYGHPADMDPIMEIAQRHNLKVIEDACPAHGSEYKGKPVGSLGDAACFSFHASKLIATGEGGMLVTDDADYAECARIIRDQGYVRGKYYWHEVIGYNYRLTNVQAAIGVAQLETYKKKIKAKLAQMSLYNKLLSKIPGISVPKTAPYAKRIATFIIISVEDSFGLTRDEIALKLKGQDIETRPVFYPLHRMKPYAPFASGKEFPIAEEISRKGLQLPSSLNLTNEDIRRICTSIAELRRG
ncbi:MAG: DegT/DnrJ/EryC1/StrS family aminotransferase [Candidatus Diapherotrites archaeon]|nr:DegT/DnrJ/EryC1/StrS family aminotransferase [Candidatus Diapherotrites archaeon]